MTTTHARPFASTTSASADASAEQFRAEAHRWARSQQHLVLLAADIDASGIWLADGHTTCASWIAEVAQVEASTAREWLRMSHALARLPNTTRAYESGDLSYAKVRTLTRLATPDNEAELLPLAYEWPASELARALAHWLRNNEEPEALDRQHRAHRRLSHRIEPDGTHRYTLVTPPEHGGGLAAALDTIVMRTVPRAGEPWPSLSQQRHDALMELLDRTSIQHVEVLVHVDENGARFPNGAPLTDTAVGRLLDGAFVRALIHDEDRSPIDATNRRRHPTTRQARVVSARDGGCVDCGRTDLVNFDHQPPFAETGHTVTSQLHQRCAPCHHKMRHHQLS